MVDIMTRLQGTVSYSVEVAFLKILSFYCFTMSNDLMELEFLCKKTGSFRKFLSLALWTTTMLEKN